MKYNPLENKVKVLVKSIIKFKLVYEQYNTLKIYNDRKCANKLNKLFEDVESPYKTIRGNQRKTEFVIDVPEYKLLLRLECKEQKTISNLIYGMYHELECVKDLPENKICYILDGVYTDLKVHKLLTDRIKELNINDRVWIGSFNEFETMLRKAVNN